jgi:hypothetical protein
MDEILTGGNLDLETTPKRLLPRSNQGATGKASPTERIDTAQNLGFNVFHMVWNGSTNVLYLNGAAVDSYSAPATIQGVASGQPFYLMRSA